MTTTNIKAMKSLWTQATTYDDLVLFDTEI